MKNLRLQPKLLFGLVAMVVVLMLALMPTISMIYRSHMEAQYSKTAFDMATVAAGMIDGDSIARYHDTLEKDEYYEQVRRELQLIRETVGLKYFYVVVPEEVQFYIWDTGDEGDEGVCDLGDTDEFYGGGYELMHGAFNGTTEKTILITNNETYGYLASAYVPILDSRGQPAALASVDISMDEINREIDTFAGTLVCIALCVLLVSSILYYFYIRKILIRPIKVLNEETKELVGDQIKNLESFANQIHTGDELQELGESFEYMTRELCAYIENLAEITKEKERIGAELNVATQIQADMLPRIFPAFPERGEFDIYATMDPAKEVGGDFYDFFLIDDDHLAMVMADVSGKGVPAALFMVIAKTLIKNRAQMGGTPAQILADVNDQLCEGNEAGLFVTVWLGILEISTGKGMAANAGHEHPAIRRGSGSFELVKYRHSPALATMEGIRFREHEFRLEPGDALYVYTDGVTEATNKHNVLFGEERTLEALNRGPTAKPQTILETVKQTIDAFVGDAVQFDDITMLCLDYFGKGSGTDDGTDA